jgi:hypothetical protein
MPMLSLETLPWILFAIAAGRAMLTAGRLTIVREQLAQTHERLRCALAALDEKSSAVEVPPVKREELEEAVRVALEVVRRDAPQRAETFTKAS